MDAIVDELEREHTFYATSSFLPQDSFFIIISSLSARWTLTELAYHFLFSFLLFTFYLTA